MWSEFQILSNFTVGNATGELVFAKAPDFEKPSDNGADNIYKVNISATDGVGAAKQSIAVLVTDAAETVGIGDGVGNLLLARVLWMDVRGNVLCEEETMLDPASPRPVAPSGHKGIALARIRFEGSTALDVVRYVVAPE